MNIRIGLVCIFFILFFQNKTSAQIKVGIEVGTMLSTTHASSNEYLAKPKISTRAGFNFSAGLSPLFSIRSGLFYASRGDAYNRPLHTLNIPLMATFHPIKKLSFGLGLEANIFLRTNMPTNYYPLTLGFRAEVAWNISPSIQLIGHFAHDLTQHHKAYGEYDQRASILKPYMVPIGHYNVTAGLSLAYTFYNSKKNNSISLK